MVAPKEPPGDTFHLYPGSKSVPEGSVEIQPLAFMVPLLHGEPQKLLGQSVGSEE